MTLVPKWIHFKHLGQESRYLHGYLRYLRWGYGVLMNATNARERSAWSDAIADEIRAERARAHLTQKDVFEAAGIPRATYLRIETGQRVADTTQLARICLALGLKVSTLTARAEDAMDQPPI